ncbi:MAG: PhoU domain-containing protein [Candidatus Bipolaricaulota bacterium]
MYQRKVQKTGGSTYFVTLPKDWADEVGIRPQAVVRLIPSGSGALLLVPESLSAGNRCTVTMGDWDFGRLQREIISRYIVGFDIIEVDSDRLRTGQRRMVREIAQALIGLEIFDESQKGITLHALVNVRDFPVERTLHRISDIALAMVSDAVGAFCRHEAELARDVVERDDDVDRLALLVARQYSLLLRDLVLEEDYGMSRLQFSNYNAVVDQLERVADHAGKISEATIALSTAIRPAAAKEIADRAEESMGILRRAVQAFVDQSADLANQVLDEREQEDRLFSVARRTIGDKHPEEASSISIALDSLLRIREYGFNIAEHALDVPAASHVRGSHVKS